MNLIPPSFSLFYAERLGNEGEPYIAARGVFTSIEEFAPYRLKGWSGASDTNRLADEFNADRHE